MSVNIGWALFHHQLIKQIAVAKDEETYFLVMPGLSSLERTSQSHVSQADLSVRILFCLGEIPTHQNQRNVHDRRILWRKLYICLSQFTYGGLTNIQSRRNGLHCRCKDELCDRLYLKWKHIKHASAMKRHRTTQRHHDLFLNPCDWKKE